MLDRDLFCRSCGYNLRGLDESGSCPECGEAVAESLGGHLLRFADPAWRERVGRGLRIASVSARILKITVIASILLTLLLGVVVMSIRGITETHWDPPAFQVAETVVVWALATLVAAGIATACVGLIMTGEPDPRLEDSGRTRLRIEQVVHTLTLPAIVTGILIQSRMGLSITSEIIAHTCAVVVLTSAVLLLLRMRAFRARCAAMQPKKGASLGSWAVVIGGVGGAIIAVHWLDATQPLEVFFFIYLWIGAALAIPNTWRAVEAEIAAIGAASNPHDAPMRD